MHELSQKRREVILRKWRNPSVGRAGERGDVHYRTIGKQAIARVVARWLKRRQRSQLRELCTERRDPRIVESAAEAHEPHRIAFYLQEVAAQFHLLWTKGKDEATLRFIIAGDPELTRARLVLVRAVAVVIASGLAVFGVEPVEEM